jgi:NADH-quinone oxidoreductase subunit J
MQAAVFIISAVIVIVGALGVVVRRNPVHAALSMVLCLFGIAVLFVSLDAQFLAAVQVIVYAGAIVVLFLFVLMLLGVDKAEDVRSERLTAQRPLAAIVGAGVLGLTLVALFAARGRHITGQGTSDPGKHALAGEDNVRALARSVFSDYVLAFELTSVLLVIAVLATVMLARRPPRQIALPEQPPLDEVTPVAEIPG